MTRASAKAFHLFAAMGLLLCAACPLIEVLCRSNDCIFLTGHDTETTLAVVLILIELTVASLKLAAAFLPNLVGRLFAMDAMAHPVASEFFALVPPTCSPPLMLRV